MSAFYASHSLMWDMPPVLTEVAQFYGIKGHKVLGIQRLGVSRTSQHWELPDEQNQARKALKEGNVDAFIMSPIGMPDPGIDNFVKPLLISRTASLPILLIALGVFGGIIAFGFVGIFVGPVLLALGLVLANEWTGARDPADPGASG